MSYKVESVIDGFTVTMVHPVNEQYLTKDEDILDFLGGAEKGLLSLAQFSVKDLHGKQIGGFCLSPFPGNCGIVVSHYAYVEHKRQGAGNGSLLAALREKLAKALGYTIITATVECTNIKQIAIMLKRGWKVEKTFKNKRTEHDCFVWTKLL